MESTITMLERSLIAGTYICLHNENIVDIALENTTISGSKYECVTFEGVLFSGIDFQATSFINCKFINCKFQNCNFEFCKFDHCNWAMCTSANTSFCITNSLNTCFHSCTFLNTNWKNGQKMTNEFHDCFMDEESNLNQQEDTKTDITSLYNVSLSHLVAA